MSLKGDIQTMTVPDHLQWAHLARKTGVTVFQKRELIKELVFEAGVLVWVNSNDPREHLGQIALQRNLIDQKRLHDILEMHKKSGVTLGQLLIEMQVLSSEQLREVLNEKFINSVYEIFLWESGLFCFSQEPISQYKTGFGCEVDLQMLILEGARRIDEWRDLRKVFDSNEAHIKPLANCPTKLEHPFEAAVLAEVQKAKTLGEILLEMRMHDYHVLTLLESWRSKAWLEIQKAAPIPEFIPPPTPQESAEADLKPIYALASQENYEEALRQLHFLENPAQAKEIQTLRRELEVQYAAQAYHLLPKTSVPEVLLKQSELMQHRDLDSKTFFLLSRIDGKTNIATIVASSPLGEAQALKLLVRLKKMDLIRLR